MAQWQETLDGLETLKNSTQFQLYGKLFTFVLHFGEVRVSKAQFQFSFNQACGNSIIHNNSCLKALYILR